MHFTYHHMLAVLIAAASRPVVDASTPFRRTVAEDPTTAQLQISEESAGDFILNSFLSQDASEYNIEFRNIVASSHECLKRFTNGHELGTHNNKPLVPDNGLILSSGNPYDFSGGGGEQSSISWYKSTNWYEEGDDTLTAYLKETNPYVSTVDACKVQFELRCVGDSSKQSARLSFNYMFGSEEYYQYENSPYADSFAFFLDGENIALLPDGESVGITTINSNVNNEYFIGNDVNDPMGVQYPQIEADGFSTQLTAKGSVNLNEWTPMKIVIADLGDRWVDSWVLIEGGSLSCAAHLEPTLEPTTSPAPTPPGGNLWYPDWVENTRNHCLNDGKEPAWMAPYASTSKAQCCKDYYFWNEAECLLAPLPTVQPTTKSPVVSIVFFVG